MITNDTNDPYSGSQLNNSFTIAVKLAFGGLFKSLVIVCISCTSPGTFLAYKDMQFRKVYISALSLRCNCECLPCDKPAF